MMEPINNRWVDSGLDFGSYSQTNPATSSTLPCPKPANVASTQEINDAAISDTKSKASPGLLSSFYNWIKQWFGGSSDQVDEKKAEKISPCEQDRISKNLDDMRKSLRHQTDITNESYDTKSFSEEIGLNWKVILARLEQIKLREEESEILKDELTQVHQAIKDTRDEINELMKNHQDAAKKALTLGKLKLGTAALTVAFAIVLGVVGVVTGGALPALLVGAQAVAALSTGLTTLGETFQTKRTNTFKGDLMKVQLNREFLHRTSDDLLREFSTAKEAVTQGYVSANSLERTRNAAMRER